MNNSTDGAQGGSLAKAPRQPTRESSDVTLGRKRVPSSRAAASPSNRRSKRPRNTADSPPKGQHGEVSDSGSNGQGKKKVKISKTDELLKVCEARPKGPFRPSMAHQLMYMMSGKQLPPIILKRLIHPLKSYATPPQFDLSGLTIPLTGKEILTFFPNHVNVPEIQHRFSHSNIKGSFQANFINHQHRLQGLEIVIPMDVRSCLKTAKERLGEGFATKPTTFTTSHYAFVPGDTKGFDNAKTPYPLLDCASFVHPCDFPMGPDSGPFTKALIQAQLTSNMTVLLSELDMYIAALGISRELRGGYTDADFKSRHKEIVKEYQGILRKSAEENGIRFDP